ncbi:MAG TPA: diaminopimelate epimerase [Dehalococcoidia bacterium]|nr:diaminopimelate epimerase [Dehalococcoidia bacterium]
MKFTKLHGTGNDFILLDGATAGERDWPALATQACDRHFGIGADGLILALPSERADVRMRIFNPDGSEAEMCGNGIRCLAKFHAEGGGSPHRDLSVETLSGVLQLKLEGDGNVERVRVNMGAPRLRPADLPVAIEAEGPVIDFALGLPTAMLRVTFVSMGNPHAVHFQSSPVSDFPLETYGPQVEQHALFPQRMNFHVARVLSPERIEVRTWERGAGPTLACGTGACATAVAARLQGLVGDRVEASVPGGTLVIEWDGQGDVYMTGPVQRVYDGEWPY